MDHPLPSLLLFAHGTSDGRGGAIAEGLAAAVRARPGGGGFGAVAACFDRQSPTPAAAVADLPPGPVVVVPLLASDGGIMRVTLPRRLAEADAASNDRHRFHLTGPLGLDPAVPGLAGGAVLAALAETGRASEQTTVLVLGHGSSRRPDSAQATRTLASALQARHGFRRTVALFLEEAPFIHDWPEVTGGEAAVAFPFFLSGGHHEERDLPRALAASGGNAPRLLPALGRHPGLVDLICARSNRTGWEAGETRTISLETASRFD